MICNHNKLWKILQEMGISDYLTCLLRNLYAGKEVTVRTGHGTKDWFQIGKGVCQGCILSPCLFNLYAEYIMRNAGLEEAQAEIKIARRNINHLRYTDDTSMRNHRWNQDLNSDSTQTVSASCFWVSHLSIPFWSRDRNSQIFDCMGESLPLTLTCFRGQLNIYKVHNLSQTKSTTWKSKRLPPPCFTI